MAETREGEPVATEVINIKHGGEVGLRGVHDAQGQLVTLEPGADPVDVEVPSPWAANMRNVSTAGTSDYVVTGSEPTPPAPPPGGEGAARSSIKMSREELNELERENLRAAKKQSQQPGQHPAQQPAHNAPKLSKQDMEGMTKAELVEYASTIGVEVSGNESKHEIIDAINKGHRHRG
jgi:hypothetical protein